MGEQKTNTDIMPRNDEGSRQLFIGRSGTGKSTLINKKIQNFLSYTKNKKQKSNLIFISPTFEYDKAYDPIRKYVEKKAKTVNEEVVGKLYNIVTDKSNRKRNNPYLIVIDDLGENTYMKYKQKDNLLNELIVTARHNNTHLIWSLQKMKQANTLLRRNADRIYGFKIDDINEKNDFYKEFAGELTPKEFNTISNLTWKEPYNYLTIDRTNPYKTQYFHNDRLLGFERNGENL